MKPTFALIGLALALSSTAPAQDTGGQRVVVPARNTGRPRKVTAHLMSGPVTVKAYSGRDVIIEATEAGKEKDKDKDKSREPVPPGMHRIDLPSRGLQVEEEDNQITVRTPMWPTGLVISVPPDTSLDLHTMSGAINVEGVKGEIVVDTMNGKASLTGVSGNVLAHSMNGSLVVTLDAADPSKPLSFTTMNGTIDVTLPADYKCNLKLSTGHGEVYSDFDVKLGGGTITQSNATGDGKFVVNIDRDRTLTGTINGGGPEATFKTYNGTIYIRKKK
ncbi:MAG TPA: DUF4097 family beta strand repeat-containing protein [Candidatus Acidoferrales bacterium]|nr:DUF4097 family beta strand repeat-containing protein [Candidatus Acidoferrales bacterium]